MVYSFLATWISFIFPVFYKRLQIRNAHWLKMKAPAIIAINHPNAFADPVGLGFIMYPTRFWYLARGDVFKPGFMSWILDTKCSLWLELFALVTREFFNCDPKVCAIR